MTSSGPLLGPLVWRGKGAVSADLAQGAGGAILSTVGGQYDTVRGRTKLGAWKVFEARLRELGLSTPEEQEERGLYVVFPTNKLEAKKLARADPAGDGWLLDYHLHT